MITDTELQDSARALHTTFGLYRRTADGRKRRTRATQYYSMDLFDVLHHTPRGMSEHRFERIITTRTAELSRLMRSDVDLVESLVVIDIDRSQS